eukprot:CAMPEP_0203953618 /NCGR_PEP_ID=MMETSP0359-20131031/86934_1 /ASSEMBLY_ACC=CAM_ASM_000338 /TAXON_ID=268821 /ORGANISM="Scrippsiella Hangoei, Strain SHTV-5" /LENGTH=303 /DNA_ID=CAMNT_0050886991 /DNA_START=6 /DNA_END=913 /DNA_ORIENTATION=+
MADLWSQRECSLMHSQRCERELASEKLLNDGGTNIVDGRGYSWKQTLEDIEILFYGHPLEAGRGAEARVVLRPNHLKVTIRGLSVFDDALWEAVRPDECTWTVEQDGILRVELQKVLLEPPERNRWPRCGRSEPHRLEKEQLAKLERQQERRWRQEAEQLERRLNNAQQDDEEDASSAAADVGSAAAADGAADIGVGGGGGGSGGGGGGECGGDGDVGRGGDEDEGASREETPEPLPAQPTATGRRRGGGTTGTAAERQRLAHLKEEGESNLWKKGTKVEAWTLERPRPGLGLVPAAEAWRRG